MNPINVLWAIDHVCYDGNLHGGGRLYWNLLQEFDRERFRLVPCMLRANATIRQVFEQSAVPVRVLDKAKFDPTALWSFLQLIRRERIQVMHLHCYASSTFGRLAGLIAGIPTIIHDYDTEVYFPYPSYLSVADRLLAPSTQGAIAASPMVKQFLIQRRKIDPAKIRMLFHGIPMEKFEPVAPEAIQAVRRSLAISDDTKVVGTFTKLGPQRGTEVLIQAAREVLETLPDVVFAIVYKTTRFHRLPSKKYVEVSQEKIDNEIAELQTLARSLNIAENIRFIEWPEDIDTWITACDLVIAPFLSERFSSVYLLEAMAKGKPIVATNLGEQREIIQDGQNGYLIEPGDKSDLASKILQCLSAPPLLAQLGQQAQTSARRYSVEQYVQTLEDWYAKLAAIAVRQKLRL
ncbi:glycosyltransferase family 4 protein [Altericista sp. CCNU0014]|uniref:glycosyltransferase family 4 protein n=1 Tax=Altericista sp. CCNU0014 TaxID=3082949 RepID=UPI00384B0DB8